MKPIGDINPASNASATTALKSRYALQKASGASGLRGEGQDRSHQPPPQSQARSFAPLHQSGTDSDVPLRDARSAPRLTAAFTAQLLGQILPDPEKRRTVGYAAPAMKLSLGFDTKL
jgi:hypothetical protein